MPVPRSFTPIGLPEDISSFAYFFAPIFPHLACAHWLYLDNPMLPPFGDVDPDAEQAMRAMSSNYGYIAPNTLLPRYARYVCDDWSSLFGFYHLPDAEAVFPCLQTSDRGFMAEQVDLCFFSIDSVFWDFFAQDESLLLAVKEHVSSLAHIRAEAVEFSDCQL